MPREAPVAASADDDLELRAALHGMSTLGFFTPKDSKGYRKAQALDAYLLPVREAARDALRDEPLDAPLSPAARVAFKRCWQLLDEAAVPIDRAHWFTPASATTRMWAQWHIQAAIRAARRHQKTLRRPPRP